VTLRPAAVHAGEHVHPVAGLGSARAGVDVDDGVVGIVLTREEPRQLLVRQPAFHLRQPGLYLRRLLLRVGLLGQLGEGDQVVGLGDQLLEGLDLAPAARDINLELLRRPRILPEIGRGCPLLQLLQLRLA